MRGKDGKSVSSWSQLSRQTRNFHYSSKYHTLLLISDINQTNAKLVGLNQKTSNFNSSSPPGSLYCSRTLACICCLPGPGTVPATAPYLFVHTWKTFIGQPKTLTNGQNHCRWADSGGSDSTSLVGDGRRPALPSSPQLDPLPLLLLLLPRQSYEQPSLW